MGVLGWPVVAGSVSVFVFAFVSGGPGGRGRSGAVSARVRLQERMDALNPGHLARSATADVRPDGDADLVDTAGFVVPDCDECGGVLKPHVVFFGENVPPDRVSRSYAAVDALADDAGALLVAGSSLTVMSGLRFVRRAPQQATPVVIVNRGATRGDDLATYTVDAGCSPFLIDLAARAAVTAS